jgi:hypothetical protein
MEKCFITLTARVNDLKLFQALSIDCEYAPYPSEAQLRYFCQGKAPCLTPQIEDQAVKDFQETNALAKSGASVTTKKRFNNSDVIVPVTKKISIMALTPVYRRQRRSTTLASTVSTSLIRR